MLGPSATLDGCRAGPGARAGDQGLPGLGLFWGF